VADELEDVATAFNDTLARLEHSVGEMRQFSAALAHELRTPLAALRGEIELSLRRSGRDADERTTLASQIEELDRLARLIDQILTLARAESGQIHLTFKPVDVGELASSLVEQLEPVAQARTIDLRCERNGTVMVNGDAGWLQRLLLNLLDNAIKFTREGGHVVLRVSREAGRARIDVRDTGIGMPPDVTPHVFERFFQADPARSSGNDGAGVGLSLVKWIVDRHEGTIAVQSRVGEGSTFTVRLP
jgi:signal transduction histidine kinase